MPEGEFTDYYALLKVDSTATDIEIRKSFLKQAKFSHPDAGGTAETMQLLNLAYKTLMNDSSRTAYNKMYALYNGTEPELDFKDDYETPTASTNNTDNADYFVDQIYSEYYDKPKKRKKKSTVKKFVKNVINKPKNQT